MKDRLHDRNRNRENYDLDALCQKEVGLKEYINYKGSAHKTIDFSNPRAVKLLNKAILNHYYNIGYWEFPDEYLCPPIPGRADYIHCIADLLYSDLSKKNFQRPIITCLDIGVGASCIYPIIGVVEYGWNFIGSDINENSIASAKEIAANNDILKGKVNLRMQNDRNAYFKGILHPNECIELTICNPPFFKSEKHAQDQNRRKLKNLNKGKHGSVSRNFSGINNELIYPGGELSFIRQMIQESVAFRDQCIWFSSLVSSEKNLFKIMKSISGSGAVEHNIMAMGTGNKRSRVVAWSFLNSHDRKRRLHKIFDSVNCRSNL